MAAPKLMRDGCLGTAIAGSIRDDGLISKERLGDLVRLLRPHFLLGSVILFLIGATSAGKTFDLSVGTVSAISAAIMVQLSCQLADDYFDRDGDLPSRRSLFAGGSGVIQSGAVSGQTVLWMTITTSILSLTLAVVSAIFSGRWLFPLLMILGLAGGLAYSAPPIRLASTRFGEISVAILLGFFLPLTGWYYAKGSVDSEVLVMGLPLFLFSLESVIAVQFPDMEADRASKKRNITFRLGIQTSKQIQLSLLCASYLSVIAEVAIGSLQLGALLVLVTVPLSMFASWELIRMNEYDFDVAKKVSNTSMTVNGITMAILLVYVNFR
jgi:1,4-dihydroxy-2-naphthoate octaprenyltransferase